MRGGGGVYVVGGMHGRGHAWQGQGGMHGGGACMAGDECDGGHVWQGGHAWQGTCMARGVCEVGDMRGRYYELRSMSGQYASYWNAFLFFDVFHFYLGKCAFQNKRVKVIG